MSFVKGMTRYLKLSSGFEFVGLFFSFTLLRSLITSLLPHFLFIVPMCRHYLTWIPFQSFLSSPALYLTSQVALPLTLNFLLSFPPSSSAYCIPFFYFCRSILGIIIFQINTSAIRTPQCVAWDCGWKDEEGDKQLEEDERVWVKKKKSIERCPLCATGPLIDCATLPAHWISIGTAVGRSENALKYTDTLRERKHKHANVCILQTHTDRNACYHAERRRRTLGRRPCRFMHSLPISLIGLRAGPLSALPGDL